MGRGRPWAGGRMAVTGVQVEWQERKRQWAVPLFVAGGLRGTRYRRQARARVQRARRARAGALTCRPQGSGRAGS